MNLGKRIELCLSALGWTQANLLNRLPDLERATLSALIKRDSKSSEFIVRIALAMGASPLWLETGEGPQWLNEPADELGPIIPEETELLQQYRQLTAYQKNELLGKLRERVKINQEMVAELAGLYRNKK